MDTGFNAFVTISSVKVLFHSSELLFFTPPKSWRCYIFITVCRLCVSLSLQNESHCVNFCYKSCYLCVYFGRHAVTIWLTSYVNLEVFYSSWPYHHELWRVNRGYLSSPMCKVVWPQRILCQQCLWCFNEVLFLTAHIDLYQFSGFWSDLDSVWR